MRDRPGWVYILAHPSAGWRGYSKIGSTKDLKARLKTYQQSDPLKRFYYHATVWFSGDRFASERRLRMELKGLKMPDCDWFNIHPTDAKLLLERAKEKHH